MKKHLLHKHLLIVAYNYNGEFTEQQRADLREKAWRRSLDGGIMTSMSVDGFGHGVLLTFDAYMVEQLGFCKRIRHSLRVFTTAIANYIGMGSVVKVVIFK